MLSENQTAKHGGQRVTIWARFADTGLGHLVVVESTMSSPLFTNVF